MFNNDRWFDKFVTAGLVSESALGLSNSEKEAIAKLCQKCHVFFNSFKGQVRLDNLKFEIVNIIRDPSFKYLHIKLQVDFYKIWVSIYDRLTSFDEAKDAIDTAVKEIQSADKTFKNKSGDDANTRQLIRKADAAVAAIAQTTNNQGSVNLTPVESSTAMVKFEDLPAAEMDIAFLVPKAQLLIMKGDILRKEARNQGDVKYTAAYQVYQNLVQEIDRALNYYSGLQSNEKDLLVYLRAEAKENGIWAMRLTTDFGRDKRITDQYKQEALDLLDYTKQRLNNHNVLSYFAYAKACFLLADITGEANYAKLEFEASQFAFKTLRSQPEIAATQLGGDQYFSLKIALQYALSLMKPGENRDLNQACEILAEEIQKAPHERRLYSALAKALTEKRDYRGALEACNRCLATAPNDTPMMLLKARALMEIVKTDQSCRSQLESTVAELAKTIRDTSLDAKPSIQVVVEAAFLLNNNLLLPSSEMVQMEKKCLELLEASKANSKQRVSQLIRELNPENLTSYLLTHFFPGEGFSALALVYQLHHFMLRNNGDYALGLEVKKIISLMVQSLQQNRLIGSLNKVHITTFVHLFVPNVKGIPDFAKFDDESRSSFYSTCKRIAPVLEPSDEEINASFAKPWPSIDNRVGLFKFYRYATLLDNSLHLTPVENFSRIFSQSSSGNVKLWTDELQMMAQCAYLYSDIPSVEELYKVLYFLDKRYMMDKGTAKPLLKHIADVQKNLISSGLIDTPAVSLDEYASANWRTCDLPVPSNNPYSQKGTKYQEPNRDGSVAQKVELKTTTSYSAPTYAKSTRC